MRGKSKENGEPPHSATSNDVLMYQSGLAATVRPLSESYLEMDSSCCNAASDEMKNESCEGSSSVGNAKDSLCRIAAV